MIDRSMLIDYAAAYHVAIDEAAAEKLDIYAQMLVEWNQKMNLTAITAPEEMVLKHFVDSLTPLPLLPRGEISLIDVGTGAAFPGVPLAVVRGDIRLTLLDSLQKRLSFLKELCTRLDVKADLVHARAEDGGHMPQLREAFDVATARAVAALPVLCEYCLPFVKTGGLMVAMKGPDGETEAAASAKAIPTLGGKVRCMQSIQLPPKPLREEDSFSRCLVFIDKITQTPAKYPRSPAKIAKQPL